jgi:toxin ParE1/3/4
MSNYKLTKLAEQDLVKIWDYTVHEWSVNQAEKYIDGLVSSFEGIAEGKIKGKAIDSVRKGYKKALHGKHYIFFCQIANLSKEMVGNTFLLWM